jgi:hypothetical protein
MKKALVLAVALAALCAVSASATTVLYVPMQKSVRLSDAILLGYVQSLEPAYNADGDIVTRVHLLVEESLKGGVRPGEVFTFDAWGGSLGGVNVETVGEAHYQLGEKVLVQLESIDGEYHTLGLSFGKWHVAPGQDGRPMIIRSLSDLNMVGVSETPVERFPLHRLRQLVKDQAF